MWMQHDEFDEDTEAGRYFLACARIRDITRTGLIKRLLAAIAEDQLVGSILDDSDEMQQRRPRERSFSFSKLRTPRI